MLPPNNNNNNQPTLEQDSDSEEKKEMIIILESDRERNSDRYPLQSMLVLSNNSSSSTDALISHPHRRVHFSDELSNVYPTNWTTTDIPDMNDENMNEIANEVMDNEWMMDIDMEDKRTVITHDIYGHQITGGQENNEQKKEREDKVLRDYFRKLDENENIEEKDINSIGTGNTENNGRKKKKKKGKEKKNDKRKKNKPLFMKGRSTADISSMEWLEKMDDQQIDEQEMNELIMDYFVCEGDAQIADIFQKESETNCTMTNEQKKETEIRGSIKKNIENGQILHAISLLEKHYSQLFCDDGKYHYLIFELQKQYLIELIRNGDMFNAQKFANECIILKCRIQKQFHKELGAIFGLFSYRNSMNGTFDLEHAPKYAKLWLSKKRRLELAMVINRLLVNNDITYDVTDESLNSSFILQMTNDVNDHRIGGTSKLFQNLCALNYFQNFLLNLGCHQLWNKQSKISDDQQTKLSCSSLISYNFDHIRDIRNKNPLYEYFGRNRKYFQQLLNKKKKKKKRNVVRPPQPPPLPSQPQNSSSAVISTIIASSTSARQRSSTSANVRNSESDDDDDNDVVFEESEETEDILDAYNASILTHRYILENQAFFNQYLRMPSSAAAVDVIRNECAGNNGLSDLHQLSMFQNLAKYEQIFGIMDVKHEQCLLPKYLMKSLVNIKSYLPFRLDLSQNAPFRLISVPRYNQLFMNNKQYGIFKNDKKRKHISEISDTHHHIQQSSVRRHHQHRHGSGGSGAGSGSGRLVIDEIDARLQALAHLRAYANAQQSQLIASDDTSAAVANFDIGGNRSGSGRLRNMSVREREHYRRNQQRRARRLRWNNDVLSGTNIVERVLQGRRAVPSSTSAVVGSSNEMNDD